MVNKFDWSFKAEYSNEEFRFPVEKREEAVVIKFPVELSIQYSDFFFHNIEHIHRKMLTEKISNVGIDVSELTFLNSRGIKIFIDWIYSLLDLPPDDRYSLTFYINKNIIWQREGIDILADLAPQLIKIESVV